MSIAAVGVTYLLGIALICFLAGWFHGKMSSDAAGIFVLAGLFWPVLLPCLALVALMRGLSSLGKLLREQVP